MTKTFLCSNSFLKSAALILCLLANGSWALDLPLPVGARQTATRDSALEQVEIPVAPFVGMQVGTKTHEGAVTRRAYRVASQDQTPLQLMRPMRDALEAEGYEILLDCNQDSCGGFDFRFAIDVLPAPGMYVNIRDYHFLSAENDADDVVSILTSVARSASYIQILSVGTSEPVIVPKAVPDVAFSATGFVEQFLARGSVVLESLSFAVGTTTLSQAEYPEMAQIADVLANRPNLQIALVGHTDSVGGLDTNISVSRARARSVRERLINDYGVDPDQVIAAGMGFLAPRASNLTEAGREANRRVEAVILRENE